jgi:hypothetical protein
MISGAYNTATGATITGTVYFPEPVDRFLAVSFLVDTGSSSTCLSLDNLLELGSDVSSRLPTDRGVEVLRGIGGIVNLRLTEAAIGFSHHDNGLSIFRLALPLMMDRSFVGLPSILGRDILFRGPLSFNPEEETVSFDPPKDTFHI